MLRKPRLLARSVRILFGNRATFSANLARLYQAWRSGGLHALKGALLGLAHGVAARSWQDYGHVFNETVRPHLVRRIEEAGAPVKISVIVPTYNTPAPVLEVMLQSVLKQLYPNWELCIADDASPQPHVRETLEAYAARDARIKLHLGQSNHGVSHASNRALEMVTGDFVVLLDHDDVLEQQALLRVAESVQHDDPDMLYSDEVLISPDGKVILDHVFRPAFSPEFLRGHPYIVHMVGFRPSLLRALGGFDESLKISQDYDLILRVAEKARTVVHLPEILYQWRIHPNSAGHQKMNEVMAVSTQALQRHLNRSGAQAVAAQGPGFNFFDMRYRQTAPARVAIIIPTKNYGDLVRQCVDSLRATVTEVDYDIVVIDHASDDPQTIAYLASLPPAVTVLRYEGPFNFSAINNWAVRQLDGRHTHYLFCNNDIEALEPGWLEHMVQLAQQPAVGIVGAQLLYPDRRTIQHAGVCIGAFDRAEHYGKFLPLPANRLDFGYMGRLILPHEVAAVTAACLLMRAEAFAEISGFDESMAVGFGDVDLCLRALDKGWRVLYSPKATLIHHESMTRGKSGAVDTHPQDTAKFLATWAGLLRAGDPYFNPGFSLYHTCWQMHNPLHCNLDLQRRVFRHDAVTGRQYVHHSQGTLQATGV
jgi:O-antigen biosynthesis protein